MEYLNTFNGNKQPVQKPLPKLVFISREMNDVALAHITANTGLELIRTGWGYEVQPETANQIAALLVTYNFKTRYFDNGSHKNELHLKNDHHIGFEVDSICFDCVQRNHINTNSLKSGDFLSC